MRNTILVLAGLAATTSIATLFLSRNDTPKRIADDYPATAVVIVTRGGFSPSDVTIRKGEAVRFTSGESQSCDLSQASCYLWPASDPHPTHDFYEEFDPREPLAPGESWTFLFEREGAWRFHDHFNAGNKGVVRVEP